MIILRNGNVHTMTGEVFARGDVLFDEKIIAVGEHISAAAREINCEGLFVMPGMVDAHCHVGMWEDGMEFEGADGNEAYDPVTPHLRAIDGINHADRAFIEARENGITTVVTGPGSANVLGGQFAALKTFGASVDEMVVKQPVAMKAALGENPKRVYHAQKKLPSTRMTTAAMLRENLIKAREYVENKQYAAEKQKPFARNMKLEALALALAGELPVKVHAHRADDIITAIRICGEFGLKYSIDHCTEGYLIPDILKENNCDIIIGPLICERSKIELKNLSITAPAVLERHGIAFAMMTDHPVIPIQYLPICAGLAVREGLSERAAYESVTINAARICGIDDRVGSLEAGKDADIAVFDMPPIHTMARAQFVYIDGRPVFERE